MLNHRCRLFRKKGIRCGAGDAKAPSATRRPLIGTAACPLSCSVFSTVDVDGMALSGQDRLLPRCRGDFSIIEAYSWTGQKQILVRSGRGVCGADGQRRRSFGFREIPLPRPLGYGWNRDDRCNPQSRRKRIHSSQSFAVVPLQARIAVQGDAARTVCDAPAVADANSTGQYEAGAISWERAACSLANGSRSDTPRNGLHRLGGLW